MVLEVFDFNGGIIRDFWKLSMKGFHEAHSVRGTVQEIRIAKSDVARAGSHLLPDILDHRLALDHPKSSFIDGNHGAMPAQMFAPAAGLRVSGGYFGPVPLQVGVCSQ